MPCWPQYQLRLIPFPYAISPNAGKDSRWEVLAETCWVCNDIRRSTSSAVCCMWSRSGNVEACELSNTIPCHDASSIFITKGSHDPLDEHRIAVCQATLVSIIESLSPELGLPDSELPDVVDTLVTTTRADMVSRSQS